MNKEHQLTVHQTHDINFSDNYREVTAQSSRASRSGLHTWAQKDPKEFPTFSLQASGAATPAYGEAN